MLSPRFHRPLALLTGLLAAGALFWTLPSEEATLGNTTVLWASVGVMALTAGVVTPFTVLRPNQSAVFIGLGLPGAALIRIGVEVALGAAPAAMQLFQVIFALIVGVTAAYAGAFLGWAIAGTDGEEPAR